MANKKHHSGPNGCRMSCPVCYPAKKYLFTVVSECLCGCGETLIDWVKTSERDDIPAVIEAMKKQRAKLHDGGDASPIAVFRGHHMDLMTPDHVLGKNHDRA